MTDPRPCQYIWAISKDKKRCAQPENWGGHDGSEWHKYEPPMTDPRPELCPQCGHPTHEVKACPATFGVHLRPCLCGIELPQAEGLRAALETLIDEVYQRGMDAPEAAEYIAAALRAEATRDEELDERRIAAAILASNLTAPDGIPVTRWDLYAGTIAREIVRAAATLTTPAPPSYHPYDEKDGGHNDR